MAEEIYERLIDALDALPNRYPRTPSRAELGLVKKAFTPEEAELAGQMSRKYETVAEIASRVGLPEDKVKGLLAKMLPEMKVRRAVVEGVERFRLAAHVVGWLEGYMSPHMDREFAELWEQFLNEGGAKTILSSRPGLSRVVPVRGSLKPDLIHPYDDIDAHFQRYERFGLMDCACRQQKEFLGKDCDVPVKSCGFGGRPPDTPLSENVLDREQALKYFGELEEMGVVHTTFYGGTVFGGGCNCCADCCALLRTFNERGAEGSERSNYRSVIDLEKCNACGNCIEYCQVYAITEDKDGMPLLNRDKCIGCGQCVIKCPTDAVELAPVSAEEWYHVPSSLEDWEEQRLRNMGMVS